MDFKPKNREWVKNAAIAFLAVLLALTFFSNTIMNRTLAEAATANVTSGSIVAKVRGSGKVVANGTHEVKADQTREVRSVMVKVGQEVNAGDVLFIMGAGDSKELEAAKDTLRELQYSYQKSAVSMPNFDYSTYEKAIWDAEDASSRADEKKRLALEKLQRAQMVYDQMGESLGWNEVGTDIEKARSEYEAADKALNDPATGSAAQLEIAKQSFNTRYQAAFDNVAACQAEVDRLSALEDTDEATLQAAKDAVAAAETELMLMNIDTDPYVSSAQSLYNRDLEIYKAAQAKYEAVLKQNESVMYELIPYKEALDAATAEYEAADNEADLAKEAITFATMARDNAQISNNQTSTLAAIDLQQIAEKIKIQQDKIKELAGEEGNQIVAKVSGTIDSIACTAGDTVAADALMCTIEVPDMGYTLSFSVTNDQAQRLRVGDTATVSNYYWGKEIVATLTTMRNDPKNPQSNKLLTFELEGDVSSGSELTISVGSKSATYDTIIPNSAIRSDTNGSFVLAVTAKNSPLGNRYIAKRVSVEVVASDDENSAVTGGLTNGDYVITTTSAPVKDGDMVRMADSAT